MGYLDSKGLQHAAWVAKNYAAQNWQMTKDGNGTRFCPAPETELEPIVDFIFTETPPAEGEKSPTNPSIINGVSVVKAGIRTKNLVCLYDNYWLPDGVTRLEDGTIVLNGTIVACNLDYRYAYDKPFPLGTYILSFNNPVANANIRASFRHANTDWGSDSMIGRDGYLTSVNQTRIVTIYDWRNHNQVYSPNSLIRVSIPAGEYSNFSFKLQFEEGDKVTEFDGDYHRASVLQLGSTYYGGHVNFKTGELTVTHDCILATGTQTSDGYAQTSIIGDFAKCVIGCGMPVKYDNSQLTCTRFPTSTDSSIERVSVRGSDTFWSVACILNKSRLDFSNAVDPNNPTGEEIALAFNAWLQANPTYVVFKRTNPLTIQLTPQQILSLPQEDKYTPRINTVYTDQKSVRVGYKRLDCIELRSDQTVHGEKTFADSPLVPNPDDLDSQQAAPISFVKDMLRTEVEAMSGGRNTIIRDQWNNPHVMVRIPKFLLKDIDSSWPNEPHPAFIVNGVQKSEIFIGKYLASQSSSGKAQTLPRQTPWTQINFDNALNACRALGNGFCLNTNASWAARALWLYKTLGGEHEYIGNNNCGRDYLYHELTGTMKSNSYVPGNTSISDAATLTGSGGIKWIDDETPYGIDDFVGNVWERVAGFRVNNGEIQIIPNNDAVLSTCNMSASSTEWKAVLQDGSLVAPGTANTLKFDSNYSDVSTWANAGSPIINTSITNIIGTGYNGVYFKNLEVLSGISIPTILKQLAIFPINNNLQGYMWVRNYGEVIPLRGGCWLYADWCGPLAITLTNVRDYARNIHGFRIAYIA